ncbi:MAG TPA: cytochrome c peroxidase [Cytophagales bacterium]|nr:cytochrome c peroxidase [Cytophagales bacterium]
MNNIVYRLHIILCILFLLSACKADKKIKQLSNFEHISSRYDLALEPYLKNFKSITPGYKSVMSPEEKVNRELVSLGHRLYFEKDLSIDKSLNCNSCHDLQKYGVDNIVFSYGVGKKKLTRNTPTVLNSTLDTLQSWDGHASSITSQISSHLLSSPVMGGTHEVLESRVSSSGMYKKLFRKAYPETRSDIDIHKISEAIAAFEAELITPSRFDKYLDGDKDALSLMEKRGLLSFINVGCVECHAGPALGGDIFKKFGVHKNYWEITGAHQIDSGRFVVTGKKEDLYVFKVPSLRNIEKTYPYFHDGSVKQLRQAVGIMAELQLGYRLSTEELDNITAFLRTLNGEVRALYKVPPPTVLDNKIDSINN